MGVRMRQHKKRAQRSGTETWPTDVTIDWCGIELFVVGWTEGGAPYGVPAEDLEGDEEETVFGEIAECDVDLVDDDLHQRLRGDVMNAVRHHARDERRAVRASIDAAVKEVYAALLSAFSPHDDEARRHE
jgi:hypothetical protein